MRLHNVIGVQAIREMPALVPLVAPVAPVTSPPLAGVR
jgi:hypothetical protein